MSNSRENTRESLVEVKDAWRTFIMGSSEVNALRGVSVSVQSQDTLSIMGPSGAGKSTLLYVMGGLERPTKGSVLYRGDDVYEGSRVAQATLRARHVGFVFQSYHLLAELNVVENVLLPARSQRGATAHLGENRERAMHLLEKVGLAERTAHRPYELSGGEQQRVAIARALINDPDLVLADEPTGNLDSHTGEQVLELLFTLVQEQGKSLVMVTHDEGVASRCRRSIVLRDGRIES